MTRIGGFKQLRSLCCGRVYSSTVYRTVNLSAAAFWTDGQKDGAQMAPFENTRRCGCGRIVLMGELEEEGFVDFDPHRDRRRPIGLWARLAGWLRGERQDAHLASLDRDPPESLPLIPDEEVEDVLREIDGSQSDTRRQRIIERELRTRSWRLGNDGYRVQYREAREAHAAVPPPFAIADGQRQSMLRLLSLKLEEDGKDWLEVAELFRQLGDFEQAESALQRLGSDPGYHADWVGFQRALIGRRMSHVALYPAATVTS
jgi:hypothetical protein